MARLRTGIQCVSERRTDCVCGGTGSFIDGAEARWVEYAQEIRGVLRLLTSFQ